MISSVNCRSISRQLLRRHARNAGIRQRRNITTDPAVAPSRANYALPTSSKNIGYPNRGVGSTAGRRTNASSLRMMGGIGIAGGAAIAALHR